MVVRTPKVIELQACTLAFLEDDVVHAHFLEGRVADKAMVQEMFEVMARERAGRKALFLVSFAPGSSLSNDARAHASSPESNAYIAADAILLRDFGHQMSANAFVRVNRPGRPIKLFQDKQEAIDWLKSNHPLIDQ